MVLYEDFEKKVESFVEVILFSVSSGWVSGFKNYCVFYIVKFFDEVVSVDEEVVDIFFSVKKFDW